MVLAAEWHKHPRPLSTRMKHYGHSDEMMLVTASVEVTNDPPPMILLAMLNPRENDRLTVRSGQLASFGV